MEERHKDCVCDACLEDARIYWERKAMTTPDPTGDALKACPFCGGRAEYANNPFEGRNTMALCVSCGAEAYYRKWQSRTSPTVSLDEVEGVLLDCAMALTEAANILTGVGYPSSGKTMTGYAEKATATATRIKERR